MFNLNFCFLLLKFNSATISIIVKVVYEDSDYEDLSRKEVQTLVWAHEVPAITETNCKKHAKKLKIPAINATEKVVVGLKHENTSASTIFPTAIDLTDSGDSEIESRNGDGMRQGSRYGIASTPSEGDLDSKISKVSSEKNEISKVKHTFVSFLSSFCNFVVVCR